MKTTRKIFIINKLLLLSILLFANLLIISQSNLTFSHNISIPDNPVLDYSSGALDIISANNKIFVYTMHKIIVLDDGGNIVDYIPFDVDERYGKFNPVYHNPRFQVTDFQLMTRFEEFGQEDMLVVTPNLDIMHINTNTLETDIWLSIPSSDPNLLHLAPLHGVCILKYEPINKRLFWLIKGRQEEPVASNPSCVGNFHYREVYFGVYNYNNSTFSRLDYFHHLTVSDDNDEYRNKNISDFEINGVNGNFFYLAKLNKLEIWEITASGFDHKHTIDTDNDIYGYFNNDPEDPIFYKFSKLVYINDGNTHKIAALPYEYTNEYELQPEKVPLIYIFDCDNYTAQRETINAPNVRIIDGVYLPQTNELAICFSKDPDDQIEKVIVNELEYESDIAIYNFDPGTHNWLQQKALLSSDNTTPIPEIDVNSPYNMMVMGNEVLVSKQDEIVRLYHVGNEYTTTGIGSVNSENNYFGKGTSFVDNDGNLQGCIINTAGGKIVKFSKQSVNPIVYNGALRLTYPVNHITSSNDGEKLFYFNKLNIEGGGFFVYDADDGSVFNVNDDTPTNNDFTSPIGDCIYNNFNNEFLVSENKDFGTAQCATIKRYNPDGTIITQAINLEFDNIKYQNAKEMYIDNNGVLNIMVNTRVGDNNNPNHPTLIQLDATSTNYSLIAEHQISQLPVSTNTAEFYSTHFCTSKNPNMLFLTVTPQEISMPSYHSEFNSMYNPNRDPNNGYLYSIINGQLNKESDITFKNPGKIICPDDGNENHQSVFEGKVYILSDKLNVHDYTSKSSGFSNKKLNDIIYSPKHDRMFALADEIGLAECITDRASIVYEVTKSGNGYAFTELINEPGQSAAFFINEFDNRLYLHTKFDNKKLGETPSKLTPYNLETNLIEAAITLQNNTFQQNRCVYPELDNNHDYHYYVYNLNTPYIDHYRNKIYLPNGANSNVSVVDITDYLPLTQGYNWISIPRHLRDFTTGSTNLEDVFDISNFTNGYTELDIYHYDAHPDAEPRYEVWWDNSGWGYDPNNDEYISQVRSRKGYKIKVGNSSNNLRLTGELETPISSIYLYQNDTNWAGYFLQQKQNIFDALGDFEQDLSYIKHRNYYCFRNHNIIEGLPIALYPWYCNSLNTDIEYGEMVVLKPVSDIVGFKWSNTGILPIVAEEDAPEYFTYEETIDYTAFIIELDSTQNPAELGAIVNDSCIGAAVVQPNDSLVIIQAYLGAQSGDSVVFEEYTGNKSSENSLIKDYFVFNEENKTHEKRIIKTGENKDRYFISFKNKKTEIPEDLIDMVNIYPNPVKNQLNIDYQTMVESDIEIIIFDAMGRKCAILLKTTQPKGTYSIYWNLKNSSNRKVEKGIYIIQLKIDNDIVNKKVIVN